MAPNITTNATASTKPVSTPSKAYDAFLAGNGDYVKGVVGLAKGLRKRRIGSIQNSATEDTDASNLKRPSGPYILFTKNEIELMKSRGHVQKISKDIRTAITERWKNLPEDAKLVFKREAKKNSETYRKKKANIKKEPHKVALKTRCAPQRVMKMVRKLNECQKRVIQELGFGGILDLNYSRLDRELCKFLVDRFDPKQCALCIGSRKLLISPSDIENMMGLKSNGIDIRISGNLKETKSVCQSYGLKEVGNITIAEVEEQLMEIKTSGEKFIFYFLLFVLSTFLCPTPKLTVKRSLILILHKIENVKNLNWAKFVLEFLVEGVRKFREKKSAGVNGCVMLLMLYYHEHVNTERIVEQLPKQSKLLHAIGSLDRPKLISTHSVDLISSEDEDNSHQNGRPCQSDHMKYPGFGEGNFGLENQLSSFKKVILDELATCKRDMRSLLNKSIEDMNENGAQVERNSGLENQLSSFKRVIFDELATCKSDILNEMRSLTNRIIGDMNENRARVESNFGLENQLSSFKSAILDELATCKSELLTEMRSLANKSIGDMNENEAQVERNPGLENQLSSFKRVIFDELATCKSDSLNEMWSLARKHIGESDNETCRPPIVISDMEFTNNSSKDTFVGPSHMWIDDLQLQAENKIINLYVCKRTHEEKKRSIDPPVWYLPTYFSKKILDADGKTDICGWLKKSFWDKKKYMSDLAVCDQIYIPMNDNNSHWYLCVVHLDKSCINIFDSSPSASRTDSRIKAVQTVIECLDKFLTFVENDKYTNKIVYFPMSLSTNHIQINGYDCGLYVIKLIYPNQIKGNLSLEDELSKNMRYKLAVVLMIDEANKQKSTILKKANAFDVERK